MRRAVVFLALAACSDPIPASKEIAGFKMPVEKTAIVLGAPVVTTEIDGMRRVEGPQGFFLTFVVTGATIGGVTDPIVLDRSGPFATTAEHESATRAHFVAAGLPQDQLAGVSSTTLIGSNGKTRYTSFVARRVEGFDVVESAASVTFVEGGVAIDEHVFWPGFLRTVVDDAHTLQNEGPAFFDKLPSTNKVGVVVIHHAGAKSAAFTATATLDILDGSITHHFDIDGNERTLPP